jgi:hypothetical protein
MIGTLARAKQRHPVQVCFFVGASNDMHLLLWVEDAKKLRGFFVYWWHLFSRTARR